MEKIELDKLKDEYDNIKNNIDTLKNSIKKILDMIEILKKYQYPKTQKLSDKWIAEHLFVVIEYQFEDSKLYTIHAQITGYDYENSLLIKLGLDSQDKIRGFAIAIFKQDCIQFREDKLFPFFKSLDELHKFCLKLC